MAITYLKKSPKTSSTDDNKTTVTQNQTQFGPVKGNKKFPYGEKVTPKTYPSAETPAQKNENSNAKKAMQNILTTPGVGLADK